MFLNYAFFSQVKVDYLGKAITEQIQYMEYIEHKIAKGTVVEVQSDEIAISSEQDALDLMANIGYLYDSNRIIIHKENLSEDFFDLKSGLAGGILQKFSNYRVQLFVVGDFTQYNSTSLKEFILESNKGKQVNFIPDLKAAL